MGDETYAEAAEAMLELSGTLTTDALSSDGLGGKSSVAGAGSAVAFRLSRISARDRMEKVIADRLEARTPYRLSVPFDRDLTDGDVLTYQGVAYEIVGGVSRNPGGTLTQAVAAKR